MATSKTFAARQLKALWPAIATVTLVGIGVGMRLALEPLAGELYTFTVFYAVVPLVAWRYGLRAGVAALGLSALVVNYALLDPAWSFTTHPNALLGLGLFLLIGGGLAVLGDGIRRSRTRLKTQAAELALEIREREAAQADVARLNALLTERVDELQAVINASPIAIGVATDAQGEHIWGNEAFAALLGVSPDRNISPAGPGGDKLPFKIYRNGSEAVATELPIQYSASHGVRVEGAEIEIVREDGRRMTFLGNAAPLHRATGEVRGAVGVFVDVTERRIAERESEEASRRKDEFLATLAHELRNPLAPLRNAASIIRQRGKGDDRLQRASDVIERQIVHMTRLVDDLLDVARITRGLVALQKESVDLRALVWQAVELVRPLLDARKQQLRVELPLHRLPLYVDRVRLIQVVANVLSNATKYTPEHGSIVVSATEDGASVKLKVRDSGIGIPSDLLPRVFDVFVQGDRTLARTEGGLGIGLTLVKKIVELHGGSVEANSAGRGHGAEFVIALPLSETLRIAKQSGAAPAAPGRQRILVVDDNPDVADTLCVLLGMIGHEVQAAYSGEQALDIAPRFQPTLAFFDIGLPGMDGYELARRFRTDRALQDVHLVALTGYGRSADRARSAEAGFELHVTKPFDPDRLEKLVQEVMANSAQGSAPPATDASDRPETFAGNSG